MSTYSMNTISLEDANKAYSKAVREARLLRERAKVERMIADALDGAYITKRLDAKLAELLPAGICERAYISAIGAGSLKYVHVHPVGIHSYDECWEIALWNGDEKRVNGEKVRKAAQGHEDEAGKIEKALEHFAELVGTYNALATAYAGIYDDLHVFFDELVYADYSARKRAERSGA